MKENVKVINDEIIVKGKVFWSELVEAKAFTQKKAKDTENENEGQQKPEKKNYSLSVLVSPEAEEEVSGAFGDLEHALFEAAQETYSAADKIKAKKGMIVPVKGGFKYHVNRDTGLPTGELLVSFRRAEALGKALVRDENGNNMEVPMLPRGAEVMMRAKARHYLLKTGQAGTSYILLDVKVLDMGAGAAMAVGTTTEEGDKIMGGASENKAPF